MTKRVRTGAHPRADKKVQGEREKDDPDDHPAWRFGFLDPGFPRRTGWQNIRQEHFAAIAATLKHLESKPMSQLYQGGGGSRGGVVEYGAQVLENEISRDARRRLAELKLELEHLVRIRIQSLPRLYAFHGRANVLNLLWWDPEHEVYPTER
jgi:hypothetical protein